MPIHSSQEFVDAMKSPVKELKIKMEFYDSKMNYISELTKSITKSDIGGISVDSSRPVRRSFTFGLLNLKNDFDWGEDELIWIDKRVKLYTGLSTRKQETIYIPQGVFIISEPVNTHNMNGKITMITGQDKAWLMTDKRGKFVDETTIEEGTDIATAIKIIAQGVGETLFLFDNVSEVVPYELTYASSDNRWKAIQELAGFAKCDVYYDENGYLRLKKIETDIDLEPITWVYEYNGKSERLYAGNKRSMDESELANHIRVLGGSSQTATVMFDLVVDENAIQDSFATEFLTDSSLTGQKTDIDIAPDGEITLKKIKVTVPNNLVDNFEDPVRSFTWQGNYLRKQTTTAKDGQYEWNIYHATLATVDTWFQGNYVGGEISFWYKNTDTTNGNYFRFYIGNTYYTLPVRTEWTYVSYPYTAGTAVKFMWRHYKGYNLNAPAPTIDLVTVVNGTKEVDGYKTSGSYVSPVIPFDYNNRTDAMKISWIESIKAGQTNIKVETNFSKDGGATWGGWKVAENNTYIQSDIGKPDAHDVRVQYRITLTSSDQLITPSIENMRLIIGGIIWANNPYSIQRIGRITYEHNDGSPDPLLTTMEECKWRAKWELMKRLGYAERVSIDFAPNWIHDAGDVIQIEDPESKVTGKYKILSFQLPLNVQMMTAECVKYVQQIKDWNFI